MSKKENQNRVRIGDREIPMLLTAYEMKDIQDDIGCTVGELRYQVFDVQHHPEADTDKGEQEYTVEIARDPEKVRKLATLMRICGNAGLEDEGKEPDLTDKWIARRIKVSMIMPYALTMMMVVSEAMKMETGEKETGPEDEILTEENRKKEPGSLHSGESAPADSSPD